MGSDLQTIEKLCEEVRTAPTSHLIALLNPDGLAALFDESPREVTSEEIKQVTRAIAAEIDRRIPVPKCPVWHSVDPPSDDQCPKVERCTCGLSVRCKRKVGHPGGCSIDGSAS